MQTAIATPDSTVRENEDNPFLPPIDNPKNLFKNPGGIEEGICADRFCD
jgi:hypothetical protein